MITVVGNRPYGVEISDLGLTIPFRVSVAVTQSQYNSSPDLQRAINDRALRVLLGPAKVGPPMPKDPRSTALRRENSQLRQEADVLKAKLQKKEGESMALQAKMDAILSALEELKDRPVVQNVITSVAPGASKPSGAVVEDVTPHYIPDVEGEGEANISVQTKEGGDVTEARNALKKLRSQKS